MDVNSPTAQKMLRYQCHKQVCALKIGDIIKVHADGTATLEICDPGFPFVVVGKDVISRYMPLPGDYYVVYDDGYQSISPAKAFEEGYTRI